MRRSESTLNVIWTLLVRIVLAVALGWFIWKVRTVFVTVILSAMLAYVMLPAVDFLCARRFMRLSKRGQRLLATIIIFIAFFFIVGISVKLLVTPFKVETVDFVKQIDVYSKKLNIMVDGLSKWYEANVPEDVRQFLGNQNFREVGSGLTGFAGRLAKSTTSCFKSIVELILIPVLAFYFVLDSRSLKREFIALMPPSRFRESMRIMREVSLILQNYVIGQVILCIIAAVLTGLVLSIMHVPYALVLAVFAGITRAIPIIGPVVSGIPICLIGATQSMTLGVSLLIFVIVMHFVESKFIMPILIGERMKLHPAIILIVLLIGAEIFGLLGMFLAAPVAAIVRELVYSYIVCPRRGKNGGKPSGKKRITPKFVGSERS